MKILNVMNFVRQCEPRSESADKVLFSTTKAELELMKELDVENTFLLQYDTLCDPKYVELFKNEITDKTELGLWYEIVEEMTDAVGLPYRSEFGWSWDWHIIPGFSMGYEVKEREMLIDEAMNKFKEVFGYYPKTVASWLMDTHTINYLTDRYEISAMGNCRDQVSVDAYTLIGGYFNQAYYPSRKNMFTPAQTEAQRVKTPMFRLLGANPIHNYDGKKYITEKNKDKPCDTMEAIWGGADPNMMDWYYRTYYKNEDMGFSYAQIGQENSFGEHDLVTPIRMQIEKAMELEDVHIMKMCDTGEWFKKQYISGTPVTSVTALDNWDERDIQSVYYDSQYYVANLFRCEQKVFFRAIYLFDENAEDKYLYKACETFDAVYENLPIVDTRLWGEDVEACGMYLDDQGEAFDTERISEKELKVYWGDKYVIFRENEIEINNCDITFFPGKARAEISVSEDKIAYVYSGRRYEVRIQGGTAEGRGDHIRITPKDKKVKLLLQASGK